MKRDPESVSSRKWKSVSETSDYFGVPRKTLYSLISRGRIKERMNGERIILKLGKAIRLNVEAIERDGVSLR